VYDARIGKFLSVDPLTEKFPWYTPYQYAGNTPIQATDLDGKEPFSLNSVPAILTKESEAIDAKLHPLKYIPLRPEILRQDINGNTVIGRPDFVNARVGQAWSEHFVSVGQSISGGVFGAIGYLWKGEEGAKIGTAADGLFFALAGLPYETNLSPKYNGTKPAGSAVLNNRDAIISLVEKYLANAKGTIAGYDKDAKIGYRGSLATGTKFKSQKPFDPADFDVDAFIVSDKLADQFKAGTRFKDARRKFGDIESVSDAIEQRYKESFSGYRDESGAGKPFTFRVYTTQEYEKIKADGVKVIN
jgi:hypothetical protein